MCGRPLTAEAAAADAPRRTGRTAPRPEGAIELSAPSVGFGNPQALRAAYLPALLAAFLSQLPFLNFLCLIWYPGAGFLSVHLYRRRSGNSPTTRDGVKLGWMAGLMSFGITLALGALGNLFPGEQPDLSDILRRQVEQTPMQDEIRRQMLEMIDNPAALATLIVFALLTTLAITVGLTMMGGALGAKVLGDD